MGDMLESDIVQDIIVYAQAANRYHMAKHLADMASGKTGMKKGLGELAAHMAVEKSDVIFDAANELVKQTGLDLD